MKNNNFKNLFENWRKFNNALNEAIKVHNPPDSFKSSKQRDAWMYEFGFEDEEYENYEDVSEKNTMFVEDELDNEKKISFNKVDETYGLNSKILSIVRKLEDYVERERKLTGDENIKGKIKLFDEDIFGFIKFDFNDFQTKYNEISDSVVSTIEFERTDEDDIMGFAKGGYKLLLTHKSTLGVNSLLFEILLEFASIVRNTGLYPDRSSITPEAQKKFHIYANRSDITFEQLDINKEESDTYGFPQLTPDDDSDDTSQEISIRHKGENWSNSVFSKLMKKNNMNTILYLCNHSEFLDIEFSINKQGELLSKLN